MNYKGAYDPGTAYDVGDVVVYTDNVAYWLQKPAVAGTPCHNTLHWGRVGEDLQDTVMMFHGILSELAESIPKNISDEAITLKGTDDAEYLITVDDSGETPELDVTLIEEEGD